MRIHYLRTHASHRVLAVARHLGLDFEPVEVDIAADGLRSPEFGALNPNRKAPVLEDQGGSLWESSAIMVRLAQKAGSDLWPSDPEEQVEVLRWLSWHDQHWLHPVGAWYFECIIKPWLGMGAPDQAELDGARANFNRFSKVLDDHLAGRDHIACGRLTVADFQLASQACHWRAAGMPMAPYANIVAWLDRMDALPAWRDPWPAHAAA